MSAFTNAVGAGFVAAMGSAIAAIQEDREASWEKKARYYKKHYEKLAKDYKELYELALSALRKAESAYKNMKEARDIAAGTRDRAIDDVNFLVARRNQILKELWETQDKLEEMTKNHQRAEQELKQLKQVKQELLETQDKLKETTRDCRQANQYVSDFILFTKELEQKIAELKQENTELKTRAANAEANQKAQLKRLQREVEALRYWHAANLALRCALEMQLLHADPDNPLLQDQDLRDRVRRAGEMAVTALGSTSDPNAPDPFDMAREAGLTFPIPGRPSSATVLSELALAEVYMRRLLALNLGAERALEALQRLRRGEGPATAARELLRKVEPDSPLLGPATVERAQAIAMEEFQRQQQQRRLQRGGPSAAWSAAMLGQRQVRERVMEEMKQEIGLEDRDGDA